MKNVIFLGSKPIGYYCLQFLLEQQEKLDIQVKGVLTNNNKRFGAEFDIPALCQTYETPLIPSLAEMMDVEEVDFLISVQYHEILKAHHIEKARVLAVNLHMAPLPEYRGCNQFSFAIVNGDSTFGTTLHRMETGIDNGAIIEEKRFQIPEKATVAELYSLTEQASKMLFEESIGNVFAGTYSLTEQASLVAERGTSINYRKDIHKLKQIDLSWAPDKIERHVRATYMPGFEPPFAEVNGQKIYLTLPQD